MRIERTLHSSGYFPCLCMAVEQTVYRNQSILYFRVVLLGRTRCNLCTLSLHIETQFFFRGYAA
jgi:hypothetical protein